MKNIRDTFNGKAKDSIREIMHDSAYEKAGSDGNGLKIPAFIKIPLQRSYDLIFIVDDEASFVFVNQITCGLLGYAERELKSLKLYDVDMLCDGPIWQKKFKMLRSSFSSSGETYFCAQGGDIFPVSVTLNYVVNDGKEYALCVARDMTAHRKMETALHECSSNYQKVIESCDIGLITVDLQGMITSLDKVIRDLTGYMDKELLGRHLTSVIRDEDMPEIMRMIDQSITGAKNDRQVECRLMNRNCKVVWCSASLAGIKRSTANTGYTIILRDITRQKSLEESLKKSEEQFIPLTDARDKAVCSFIPDGTITNVNSAFYRISGKQFGELVGCNFLSFIAEKDHAKFISSINKSLENPAGTVSETVEFINADGEKRPYKYALQAVSDEGGQIVLFQVSVVNATAPLILKGDHSNLDLGSMLGGIAVFEIVYEGDRAVDSRFVGINDAFEKFLGIPASEVIGKTVWEIFPATTIVQANLWWESVLRHETICLDELYFTDIDRYLRLTGFSPERGRYVIMIMDVTENKKSAGSVISRDQRVYSLGEMAAGLVHEANNPLIGVVRLSQVLLAQSDLPSNIRQDLISIESEASRAACILKEFLVFAKQPGLKKAIADINVLINGVLQLHRERLKRSQIDVKCDLDRNLQKVMVDAAQVQQVFTNIILNAEYFMYEAQKKGILRISSEQLDDRIKIVFEDNGPGIDAKDMANIFKPFFSTKGAARGTGLGLSVSYRIVKAHNGNIFAETCEGGGVRFIIELPLVAI